MANSSPRNVMVRETPIELSQFIKFAGLAATGGEAKQAVVDGQVEVNGEVETRRGRKLQDGDKVAYGGETLVVTVAKHR